MSKKPVVVAAELIHDLLQFSYCHTCHAYPNSERHSVHIAEELGSANLLVQLATPDEHPRIEHPQMFNRNAAEERQ